MLCEDIIDNLNLQGTLLTGDQLIKVLRVAKGAKVKKLKTGAKGKKTLDYDSEDLSSSGDLTPKATIVKGRSDSVGKQSVKELLKNIKEKDKKIRSLEVELSKSNLTSRMNKRKVQEELKWTGEETNLAETVNHFCRNLPFSTIQVPQGWMERISAR